MPQSAANPLEKALQGRHTSRGPMAGGYTLLGMQNLLTAASGTVFTFRAPFPCRVMAITAHQSGATAGATYAVTKNAVALVASRAVPSASGETIDGGVMLGPGPQSTNTARDMVKGDSIIITTATAAGVGVMAFGVYVYPTGHVNSLEAND
jgi:hypothetical protein